MPLSSKPNNSEPRWPAGIAVIAIGGLYAALPPALIVVRPRWLILAIVALIMVPTIISHRTGNHFLNQVSSIPLRLAIPLNPHVERFLFTSFMQIELLY
jgi:hypothetical protein